MGSVVLRMVLHESFYVVGGLVLVLVVVVGWWRFLDGMLSCPSF